jgi:hypothetical protein
MENIICDFCSREFKKKKSQLKLSAKHYCSIHCSEQGRRKGKTIQCFTCDKLTYKSLKDLKNSKSGKYFCSQICSNVWIGKQQRAGNNPNWTGGLSSYKILLKRTKSKQVCNLCGKDNLKMLCVHHLDRNRKNNNMQNLIWLCRNCHFLVHHYKKEENRLFKKELI